MNPKIKKILVGLGIAGTLASGTSVGVFPSEPLTINEYQTLIEIYNYEIEQSGGKITLKDVKGDTLEKLHDKILERQMGETVIIKGEEFSQGDYKKIRKTLFDKAEKKKQSLLDLL